MRKRVAETAVAVPSGVMIAGEDPGVVDRVDPVVDPVDPVDPVVDLEDPVVDPVDPVDLAVGQAPPGVSKLNNQRNENHGTDTKTC